MSVQPVIEQLIKEGNARGSYRFMQPVLMQVTKHRANGQTHLFRLGDGQYSVAVQSGELPNIVFETGRILKLTSFSIAKMDTGSDTRVFLDVAAAEDAGPGTIGEKLPGLKYSDIAPLITKTEIPMNEDSYDPQAKTVAETTVTTSTTPAATTSTTTPTGTTKLPPATPIEAISSFVSNWKILARCTKKSDIREFKYRDRQGETGKMFKVTFTDQTGDIEAVGFTEAVDTFYSKIVEGQQYFVSKMQVKETNKRFNTTGHDFDLAFTRDTVIEPANVDVSLPKVFFKFLDNLKDLERAQKDSHVDVIGVISSISELSELTSKTTNLPYTKREITILDDTQTKTNVALWGQEAEQFSGSVGDIVAIKHARVSDFNGISLSTTRQSNVILSLDTPRAYQLKGWWDAIGHLKKEDQFNNIGQNLRESMPKRSLTTVNQINALHLTSENESQWFYLKARIATVFSKPLVYAACSVGEKCQKRVLPTSDGFRCESCNKSMEKPNYRYVLSMVLSDITSDDNTEPSTLRVSVFDQVGRVLYGDRAEEFAELKAQSEEKFNKPLEAAVRSIQGREYFFNLQSTVETYEGVDRLKFQVRSVKEVDPVEESERLLTEMGF